MIDLRATGITPDQLNAYIGSRLVFVNKDGSGTFDIYRDGWDTGALGPGQQYVAILVHGGTFVFHCREHPELTLTVNVPDQNPHLSCNANGCTVTWS